jgi:hypothetical protein
VPLPTQPAFPQAPQQRPGTPVNPTATPTVPPSLGQTAPQGCPGANPVPGTGVGAPFPVVTCPDGSVSGNDPSQIANRNDQSGCGWSPSCIAKQAITDWFKDLVESAKEPTFRLLGHTLLATPELDSPTMARPRELSGTSRAIANTCFVLLITIAGILVMCGRALPGGLSPNELLPRIVVAFGAANLSPTLLGYGISLANGLANAFLTAGAKKINPEQAGKVLADGVEASLNTGGTFFILIALIAVALAVCVAFIYVARLALTMVLIAAAPIALMFHALPHTDGLARLWWRGITGLLAIQVCQSLVLVTALRVLFTDTGGAGGAFWGVPTTKKDVVDTLLVICLLWVMIRIPSWVARTIWRPAQPRMLGQLAKSFLIYRTVGAVAGAVGKGARRAAGHGTGRSGRGPTGGGPGSRPGGGPGGGRGGGSGGHGGHGGGSGPGRSPHNPGVHGHRHGPRPGPGPGRAPRRGHRRGRSTHRPTYTAAASRTAIQPRHGPATRQHRPQTGSAGAAAPSGPARTRSAGAASQGTRPTPSASARRARGATRSIQLTPPSPARRTAPPRTPAAARRRPAPRPGPNAPPGMPRRPTPPSQPALRLDPPPRHTHTKHEGDQ